jgi:PAS domain S-box-containing protein
MASHATGGPRTIVLHVDDERPFLDLTGAFVARFAPEVEYESVTSPTAVLDRLAAGTVDCLVSDYEMPGLDGLELLSEVRSTHPSLPFVLFTGKGSEEIASEAITAGVTDYLQKSTDAGQFELLVHSLRNAVDRHRSDIRIQQVYDAIDQIEEGVSLVGEDDRFVYVNESYASAFGYNPSELVGEHWRVLYRDASDVRVVEKKILAGVEVDAPWHGQTLHRRRDGSLFYADHHVGVCRHGLVVSRVTELKDAAAVTEETSPILRERGETGTS